MAFEQRSHRVHAEHRTAAALHRRDRADRGARTPSATRSGSTIVRELDACGAERTCGSFDLPIAKSTATHHWRVLRDAGVVSAREEGTKKYHRLRRADLDARFPGLLDSVVATVVVDRPSDDDFSDRRVVR